MAALILIGVWTAGCATIRSNACDGFAPIVLTHEDALAMDPGTKRQIVAHNEFGEKVCGWKAVN